MPTTPEVVGQCQEKTCPEEPGEVPWARRGQVPPKTASHDTHTPSPHDEHTCNRQGVGKKRRLDHQASGQQITRSLEPLGFARGKAHHEPEGHGGGGEPQKDIGAEIVNGAVSQGRKQHGRHGEESHPEARAPQFRRHVEGDHRQQKRIRRIKRPVIQSRDSKNARGEQSGERAVGWVFDEAMQEGENPLLREHQEPCRSIVGIPDVIIGQVTRQAAIQLAHSQIDQGDQYGESKDEQVSFHGLVGTGAHRAQGLSLFGILAPRILGVMAPLRTAKTGARTDLKNACFLLLSQGDFLTLQPWVLDLDSLLLPG